MPDASPIPRIRAQGSSFGVITLLTLRSTPVRRRLPGPERSALALFEADLIILIIAAEDSQARDVLQLIDNAIGAVATWTEAEIERVKTFMGVNVINIAGEFSRRSRSPARSIRHHQAAHRPVRPHG